jgi:hypothetical protein
MTLQMQESLYTQHRVNYVIRVLKSLTATGNCVDGETMQHIIEEVGMQDQMLRQLMMSADRGLVESLWDEIVELEKSRD